MQPREWRTTYIDGANAQALVERLRDALDDAISESDCTGYGRDIAMRIAGRAISKPLQPSVAADVAAEIVYVLQSVATGRKGGSAKTERKAQAARESGKLGGRPSELRRRLGISEPAWQGMIGDVGYVSAWEAALQLIQAEHGHWDRASERFSQYLERVGLLSPAEAKYFTRRYER